MSLAGPNRPTTIPNAWMFGCAVWFLTIAPVFIGVLLAVLIGGFSAAWIGAALGLIASVASYRYGSQVLRAARDYQASKAGSERDPDA